MPPPPIGSITWYSSIFKPRRPGRSVEAAPLDGLGPKRSYVERQARQTLRCRATIARRAPLSRPSTYASNSSGLGHSASVGEGAGEFMTATSRRIPGLGQIEQRGYLQIPKRDTLSKRKSPPFIPLMVDNKRPRAQHSAPLASPANDSASPRGALFNRC